MRSFGSVPRTGEKLDLTLIRARLTRLSEYSANTSIVWMSVRVLNCACDDGNSAKMNMKVSGEIKLEKM